MAFPIELASILTGASLSQLRRWRSTGLLVPEVQPFRPPLYSFRDLVALRTFVYLRNETSLQKVRKALNSLREDGRDEHPAGFDLRTDRETIALRGDDDALIDLVKSPGTAILESFGDAFRPFVTNSGREVADFEHPRPNLEVMEGRLGGWPTATGTRVPFDDVALLQADGDVTSESVAVFYPSVTPEAAADALALYRDVEALKVAS